MTFLSKRLVCVLVEVQERVRHMTLESLNGDVYFWKQTPNTYQVPRNRCRITVYNDQEVATRTRGAVHGKSAPNFNIEMLYRDTLTCYFAYP